MLLYCHRRQYFVEISWKVAGFHAQYFLVIVQLLSSWETGKCEAFITCYNYNWAYLLTLIVLIILVLFLCFISKIVHVLLLHRRIPYCFPNFVYIVRFEKCLLKTYYCIEDSRFFNLSYAHPIMCFSPFRMDMHKLFIIHISPYNVIALKMRSFLISTHAYIFQAWLLSSVTLVIYNCCMLVNGCSHTTTSVLSATRGMHIWYAF